MARSYPSEFRDEVLDLIASGRSVAEVATNLSVSGQTIHNSRNQGLIDRGMHAGVTHSDFAELVAVRRRISELEVELAARKRANELLKHGCPQKGGSRPSFGWRVKVTLPRWPARC